MQGRRRPSPPPPDPLLRPRVGDLFREPSDRPADEVVGHPGDRQDEGDLRRLGEHDVDGPRPVLAVGRLQHLAADPRGVVAAGVGELILGLEQRHGAKVPTAVKTDPATRFERTLSATRSRFLVWGMRDTPLTFTGLLDNLDERPMRSPHMADLDTLTLPVLPLTNDVVLPHMVVTLALETDEARAGADAAARADDTLLLVPRQADGRYARVGTIARIENRGNLPGGMPALVIRATTRAEVGVGVIGQTAALWVHVSPISDGDITDEVNELATELRAALRALFESLGGRRLTEVLRGVDDPSALADIVGWWPDLAVERKVELLETTDLGDRVRLVLGWVKEALAEHQLADKIRHDVSEGLEARQREFMLRQQMDAIRKELGEDGEEDLVGDYRDRLSKLVDAKAVTDDTRKAIEREIDRFERTPEQNVEHGWIRNWLDTVFEIPWGERSVDDYDIDRARRVLDEDHTGLEEVKERIVELLGVRKLLAERAAEEAAEAESEAAASGETELTDERPGDDADHVPGDDADD